MTLRNRLIAAFVAMVVLLAVGSLAVTLVQRSYLRRQVDARLETLSPEAGRLIVRLSAANRTGNPSALADVISDYYVGRITTNGRVRTVLAPADAPDLTLDLPATVRTDAPFTVGSDDGDYRVIETNLSDGSTGVLGISLRHVEAAVRRLVITEAIVSLIVLALTGLIMFWVFRLGLRPIRRMTDAADAISAGDADTRVDVEPDDRTEAGRLGRALDTMIITNRESEDRLRRFVADASHELRTPLTTLRGYASLHEAGGLSDPESLDDAMRRIGQEATRMGRIVDDLLLLARLDEHGAPTPTRVSVAAVFADIASDLSVVQPDRVVLIDVTDDPHVLIDHDHFVQSVSVLTTNALRHTAVDAEITLRARIIGDRVRVEVSDRGPGIDPADRPHLFDRFYRSDAGRSRASGGNGLGLAILASIISSNGGTYGVESVVGLGSTFWFELPLAP